VLVIVGWSTFIGRSASRRSTASVSREPQKDRVCKFSNSSLFDRVALFGLWPECVLKPPLFTTTAFQLSRLGLIDRSHSGGVGPERSWSWCVVVFSERKSENRASSVLPRWFVGDGLTRLDTLNSRIGSCDS